jgi:hypothetical protein
MSACFSSDGHCDSKGDIATLVLTVAGRKGALTRQLYLGLTHPWIDRQYPKDVSVISIKNHFVDQYSQQFPFFRQLRD